jgi:hypothetical protein
LDTNKYAFATNNNFEPGSSSSKLEHNKEKEVIINYNRFNNSYRWYSGEQIHEICTFCDKKKCSCGGCPDTDVYEWVETSSRIPLCQRCICCDTIKNTSVDIENLNETGRSLDELVKEHQYKGKPLEELTDED